MLKPIVKFSATLAALVAAQVSFAQINMGLKTTTQAAAKVQTGVVNKAVQKTISVTKASAVNTTQKAADVKTTAVQAVKEGAQGTTSHAANGHIKSRVSVGANVQLHENGTSGENKSEVGSASNISVKGSADAEAGADGNNLAGKAQSINEKTKQDVDGTKTKAKEKVDGAKIKVKETQAVDAEGKVKTETKITTVTQ